MKLPSYRQLSKEQDKILNIPLGESCLVTGPPGTGKTVMALYRAQLLQKQQKSMHLLMYSNLLSQYTASATDELKLSAAHVSTYHKWFGKAYYRAYRHNPPANGYTFKWLDILQKLNCDTPPRRANSALLIDEGQDLPKEFYIAAQLFVEQLAVFADENQRLTEHHSTIDEIRTCAMLDDDKVYKLTRNYRNTRQIWEVAKHFYCGLSTGIPDAPTRSGPLPQLLQMKDLNSTVEFIARFAKNNPDRQVGVFTCSKKQQKKFWNRLNSKLSNTNIPVQMYCSRDRNSDEPPTVINFDSPGIFVVNYPSTKGLEFDAVFLPELQEVWQDTAGIQFKMAMYVMCSRARDQLFLTYSGHELPIINILPGPELLERRAGG